MTLIVLSENRDDEDPAHLALPIADRAMVGIAVGMAIGGKTPIVEVSSSGRLLAMLEPLAEAASLASDGEFGLQMLLVCPLGDAAGERVDRPVLDTLASIRGLHVLCASTHGMVEELEQTGLSYGAPTVLFEPRVMPAGERIRHELGREAIVSRRGQHITLLAYGEGVTAALQAAHALLDDGIDATVVDLVSLAPLDVQTITAEVTATGRVVAIGERAFCQRVLRTVTRTAFLYLESPPATAAADATAIAIAARAAVRF